MSKWKLFLLSLLLTIVVRLAWHYVHRPRELSLVPVADGMFVTSQLQLRDVRRLNDRGIKTLVDIRPDGEAADQPTSSSIEAFANGYDIHFHYIPVPHESIPDTAVDALGEALSNAAKPTVLYCRTGRRAVRLYALEEASRAGGPNTEAILKMVQTAGFSADDLKGAIEQRLAHRGSVPAATHP